MTITSPKYEWVNIQFHPRYQSYIHVIPVSCIIDAKSVILPVAWTSSLGIWWFLLMKEHDFHAKGKQILAAQGIHVPIILLQPCKSFSYSTCLQFSTPVGNFAILLNVRTHLLTVHENHQNNTQKNSKYTYPCLLFRDIPYSCQTKTVCMKTR